MHKTQDGKEIDTTATQIEGKLTAIKFKGKRNFFVGNLDGINIVGNIKDPKLGFKYKLRGKFARSKYNNAWQFEFNKHEVEERPWYGIEKYLIGECPHVSKERARMLVEHFGRLTFQKIRTSPEEVNEIIGAGPDRARDMKRWMEDKTRHHEVRYKLYCIGCTTYRTDKILTVLGKNCIPEIQKNCYQLINIKALDIRLFLISQMD